MEKSLPIYETDRVHSHSTIGDFNEFFPSFTIPTRLTQFYSQLFNIRGYEFLDPNTEDKILKHNCNSLKNEANILVKRFMRVYRI